MMTCKVCEKNKTGREQWWHLTGYFGITGTLCGKCYDKVSHDGCGKPNHQKAYERVKQALKEKQ